MTTPKRTGDEEGRIVHGGELPEDDGSLDDVVVDPPQTSNPGTAPPKKRPDELWTNYLIRRLAYEGIDIGYFEEPVSDDDLFIYLRATLNSGVLLELTREIDLKHLQVFAGSTKPGVSVDLKGVVNLDGIDLSHEQNPDYFLKFVFYHWDDATTANFYDNTPPEFKQLPFIRNYEPNKIYPAEQIITDLVNYIKETGIKK